MTRIVPREIINDLPVSELEEIDPEDLAELGMDVRPPNRTIAALFVLDDGPYFDIPNVEPYGLRRDARKYEGPYPAIAHPPCARWGRLWFGGMRWKSAYGERKKLGDDDGCFLWALAYVRKYGGVIEHPKFSKAYSHFGITIPPKTGGWVQADEYGGICCEVDQRWYGHPATKLTWLYAFGIDPPELKKGRGPESNRVIVIQNPKIPKGIDPLLPGITKPMRKEATGTTGLSPYDRAATPAPFKQLLIDMVESVDLERFGKPRPNLFGVFEGDPYEETLKVKPPPGVVWDFQNMDNLTA